MHCFRTTCRPSAAPGALRKGAKPKQLKPSPLAAAAASTPGVPTTGPIAEHNPLLMGAVETLFKIPPLWEAAKENARQKIQDRAVAIGLDWDGAMAAYADVAWDEYLEKVTNCKLQYPDYYTKPFHAYNEGNLCWEAALELEMAAKAVHAPVMDPDNAKLDPEGDQALRQGYHDCQKSLLSDMGISDPKDIVDLGCASGLSSLALLDNFPGAAVTGVDLSPNFLAVGLHAAETDERRANLTLRHGLAEATGLPDASADLVSVCLVMHELPAAASCAVIEEAFRILRPGGALSIMEMDPVAPKFVRVFSNPFAYAAFKSTEPWLQEYISLDLHTAILDRGFERVDQLSNSPGHRTVVAVKPN